jgi:hypothetical protein
MRFEEIEAYLAQLSNVLQKHGVSNTRMVEEARGHLADDAEAGIRCGLESLAAQREALARFGSAESVAATFLADTYGRLDRRVWLAASIIGIAIAFVDSRPAWDDAGVTAFLLVAAGALCGFAAPRQPWRWVLAVGIWICTFALIRSASFDALVMLSVVLFSLSGAYAGAAIRCARSTLSPHQDNTVAGL